jgi:hypothetical protein
MGGLNEALKAASAKAQEEHARAIRDRFIQYHADVYGYAQQYDNTIVLAGYAAFFGLWAGVHNDVTQLARLVTVMLMGTSLIFYIAWHLLQMITRQKYEFRRADLFSFASDLQRFNKAWEDNQKEAALAQAKIIRLWPFIFVPSVALGFLGGIILTWNAAMAALNIPLQLQG